MSLVMPKIVREKLGDDGTEELIKIIDDVVQASIKSTQGEISSNFEKILLETEKKIIKEINESRFSVLKYNLLFWTGQLAVTIGILALFHSIVK